MRGGNQAHARRALDPHLAIPVEAGRARAASAATEEGAEGVGVSVGVAGPVLETCMDDIELEGEEVLEDVCAGGGRCDAGERAEEVGRFC